jgi:4-amino-4-deoxy-L-arabinose transferase-like glycosyltransferase
VSSFIFAGVITFYAGLAMGKIRYFLVSGFLCGLGLLTKSITITALGLNFVAGLYFFYLKKDARYIKYFVLSCVVAAVVFFTLFPAMWVSPIQTLNRIYTDGIVKTGIMGEDSFGHTVRGITTRDPGYGYYFRIFEFRLSPLAQVSLAAVIIVICLFYFKKIKNEQMTLVAFSALYILGYFIIFSILQKKTDRYIAPMLPFISLAAVLTMQAIYIHIKSKKLLTMFILLISIEIAVNLLTIIKIHPYYMAYYSPVWGGINKAKKKIYINQGGIGAYEIASFLNSKDLTPADKIGATNLELQAFSKYFIHALDPDARKTYRYVVLTLQKDDDFKHGMTQVYSINVLGDTYFRVYKR